VGREGNTERDLRIQPLERAVEGQKRFATIGDDGGKKCPVISPGGRKQSLEQWSFEWGRCHERIQNACPSERRTRGGKEKAWGNLLQRAKRVRKQRLESSDGQRKGKAVMYGRQEEDQRRKGVNLRHIFKDGVRFIT